MVFKTMIHEVLPVATLKNPLPILHTLERFLVVADEVAKDDFRRLFCCFYVSPGSGFLAKVSAAKWRMLARAPKAPLAPSLHVLAQNQDAGTRPFDGFRGVMEDVAKGDILHPCTIPLLSLRSGFL